MYTSPFQSTESLILAVRTLRIFALPLERLGIFVVLADVAHELLVHVFERSKDAPADAAVLYACKPVHNLVETRLVNLYVCVLGQKHLHRRGLVAADVVADNVDFSALVAGCL